MKGEEGQVKGLRGWDDLMARAEIGNNQLVRQQKSE